MRFSERLFRLPKRIFQKLFHVPKPAFYTFGNTAFRYTFGPRNLGFAQAEYVMGIDPPALCIRECVQGGAELLCRNLALIEFTGRQSNKKSFVLDTVSGVQRKICLIPVHTADIIPLNALGFSQSRRYFIRDFYKQIVMVKRVKILQVNLLDSNTSIPVLVDE